MNSDLVKLLAVSAGFNPDEVDERILKLAGYIEQRLSLQFDIGRSEFNLEHQREMKFTARRQRDVQVRKNAELVENNAKLIAELNQFKQKLRTANHRLAEIGNELDHHNLHLAGWHLNGDTKKMSEFFENNDWSPVE